MTMRTLSFLADMNLSPLTVAALQQAGVNVIRVSEVLPATTSDSVILAFARQEGRVVITQDLDFSALVAIGGYAEPSLVTLRLSTADPATVTRTLLRVLPQVEAALQQGCAVTIDDRNVRIRRLPIR